MVHAMGFLLTLLLPAAAAADFSMYQSIQSVYESYSKKSPTSCEAIYYGLFAKKETPSAERPPMLATPQYTRQSVKEQLRTEIPKLSSAPEHRSPLEDWTKALKTTPLHIYDAQEAKKKGLTPEGAFLSEGEILYGAARSKTSNPAADAFVLGHELGHLPDWIPPQIASCLASPQSIKASESFRGKLERAYFQVDLEQEYRRQTEGAQKNRPALDAGVAEMDFASGRGTENILSVETLLEEGNLSQAKRILDKNSVPDQIPEAAADYIGAIAVARFIQTSYPTPEKKRAAGLAVLASMPPMLYSPQAAEIMNRAGSKQTNERRVLRILLANSEFRKLIGCSFADEAPKECP